MISAASRICWVARSVPSTTASSSRVARGRPSLKVPACRVAISCLVWLIARWTVWVSSMLSESTCGSAAGLAHDEVVQRLELSEYFVLPRLIAGHGSGAHRIHLFDAEDFALHWHDFAWNPEGRAPL